MYRIDNITADASLPSPQPTGPNPDGYFFFGDPANGIPATVADADWLNAVQEELCNVISDSGQTLSKTVRTQLLDAIDLLNQAGAALYAGSSSSPNTYSATLSPVPFGYVAGMVVFIKFDNANTGSATINLNSLGAKNIKRLDGSNLSSGDIQPNMIAGLAYDGTDFQLLNPFNTVIAGNGISISNNIITRAMTTQSVSGATTLNSSAFSNTVVCTGSSAYTITLPSASGNAGRFVEFVINTTSYAIVTIVPAAGSIDGRGNVKYGSSESSVLYCDGSNWIIFQEKIMPVAFSVSLSVDPTIPNLTSTKLAFDTAQLNTGGFFDTSTYRFTPKYPGVYSFTLGIQFITPSANITLGQAQLRANGGNLYREVLNNSVNTSTVETYLVSADCPMDGISDNMEAWVLQNSGASQSIYANTARTFFFGKRINNTIT